MTAATKSQVQGGWKQIILVEVLNILQATNILSIDFLVSHQCCNNYIGIYLLLGCTATAPYDVSCCNSLTEKCGENEGDCDSDAHCKAGLACGTDNCPAGGNFPPEADCCYKVTGIKISYTYLLLSYFWIYHQIKCADFFQKNYWSFLLLGCTATDPYSGSCCNFLTEKCGENEGDCDSDAHCKAGLTCGIDNCPAGGNFHPEADCCFKVTGITISYKKLPNFHIFVLATWSSVLISSKKNIDLFTLRMHCN